MTKKLIPELDKLFTEVGAYRKSSEFDELFAFMKKFPRIAPFNAMLIHIQKPGSDFVASASVWKKRFDRDIKAGARPLMILQPFGPVAFIFELGDTEGEDFPEALLNPFKVDGEISGIDFNYLVNNLKCDGIAYREIDHGTSSAGFIQNVSKNDAKRELLIATAKKKTWVQVLYDLVVNRNHSQTTSFATITHELGHLYCGHLGIPDLKWKGWKDRRNVSKNSCEFEAESVCWLICERMGIKNPSAEYLSGYLKNNNEIPDISIDSVLKAAGQIESMIIGNKEPRKEIVMRTEDIIQQQLTIPH